MDTNKIRRQKCRKWLNVTRTNAMLFRKVRRAIGQEEGHATPVMRQWIMQIAQDAVRTR